MATKGTQNLSLNNLGDMQILANDIKKFIQENKLSTNVQGKEFPQAEAWQYAGNRLGLIPQAGHLKNLSTDTEIKYQASILIVDLNNNFQVLGRGFAVCSNREQGKKFYQEFAICSMAQTRAIGKAYRIMLSFLMRLAGYEPTPAEEMDYETNKEPLTPPRANMAVNQPRPLDPHLEETQKLPAPAGLTPPPPAAAVITPPAGVQEVNGQTLEISDNDQIEATPIKYASARQKADIIDLLNNPVITRPEKTKMLLNINKLDETRAGQAIIKLKHVIKEREDQSDAA